MDKFITEVTVNNENYTVVLSREYFPIVGEHNFNIEIFKGTDVIYTNNYTIYTKKDAEKQIRNIMKCKGKRFIWREVL